MPKLDLDAIEQTNSTGYPPPFDAPMASGAGIAGWAPRRGLTEISASAMSCLKPGGVFASATGMRARTSSSSCWPARRC